MEMNLRNIYKVNDVFYYDVVTYDKHLVDVSHSILNLKGLEQRLANCGDIKRDFDVEDGILKCNSLLETYLIDESFLHSIMSGIEEDNKNSAPSLNSIYGLFAAGVSEDYLILDNNLENWEHGYGVSKFSSVRFSKNTMSVYTQMHAESGIYNKMIVILEDGLLQFKPFYVATSIATNDVPGCTYLKRTVNINNVEYKLWQTNILQVYDNVLFSGGLVNQACCESTIYSSALSVCNDYIGSLTEYLGESRNGVCWVGGEQDYKSPLGVFFQSTCLPLNKRLQAGLRDKALEFIVAGYSKDEVIKKVTEELDYVGANTRISRFALYVFTSIAMKDGDLSDKLKFAFEMKDMLERNKFWLDMYLYRVRATSYFLRKKLTSPTRAALFGGNTAEYTSVKAIFD